MTLQFLAAAETDVEDAAAYYEAQEPGLGDDFAEAFERAIRHILDFPEASALISKRTRRHRMRRFPYGIIYQIRGGLILIVAVMHLRRSPKTWQSRLPRRDR